MALKLPVRSLASSRVFKFSANAAPAVPLRSFAIQTRPSHCVQRRTFVSPSKGISTSPTSITATSSRLPSRSTLLPHRVAFSLRQNGIRSASSAPSPAATAAAASQTSPASNAVPSSLTWDEYLSLRTKRRRINVIFSAACALSTTALGASFVASQDLEMLQSFSFGMDPMVVLGAATAAFGMIGWLVGPFLGAAVFSVLYRRVGPVMREKEKDFFNRIKRNRSDPSGQSVNNPVPDYYGEKITSVKDYRRWLKDQRAFRKKREVNVI